MFIIYILSFLLSMHFPGAEQYHVIHIKGNIQNTATGKALAVGDKISATDKLKFSNAQDVAVVIGTERGRYSVTPSSNKGNSELMCFVSSIILPVKSNVNLSVKGEKPDGVVDLKNYLGTSDFAVIGNRLDIRLNPSTYPLSDEKYFIYRYIYNDKPVNKKISYAENSITLERAALYTIEGKTIPAENIEKAEIYYYDAEKKSSMLITTFHPVFIEENHLKEEINTQVKIYKEQGWESEAINKEISSFILDIYGKTDEDTLKKWLSANVSYTD